jgi:hypothetical protein
MLKNTLNNFQKKSLKERFLLVMGMSIFLGYFVLGLIIVFWNFISSNKFPIFMEPMYRVALGVVLIGYSYIRFLRFFNSKID